jgi:hypothetical protein
MLEASGNFISDEKNATNNQIQKPKMKVAQYSIILPSIKYNW